MYKKYYLFVFEPRQRFGSENEPIIPGTSFHQAQIMDGHVALANDLVAQFSSGFFRALACIGGTLKKKTILLLEPIFNFKIILRRRQGHFRTILEPL